MRECVHVRVCVCGRVHVCVCRLIAPLTLTMLGIERHINHEGGVTLSSMCSCVQPRPLYGARDGGCHKVLCATPLAITGV